MNKFKIDPPPHDTVPSCLVRVVGGSELGWDERHGPVQLVVGSY